jgi:pilus assembly protein CpaF
MSHRIIDEIVAPTSPDTSAGYQDVLRRVHEELVSQLDLSSVKALSKEALEPELRRMLERLVEHRSLPISDHQRAHLIDDLINEVVGLGPIEELLHTPDVTDILINGPNLVYVEKGGKLSKTNVRFRDTAHLLHVIDRIVSAVGRRVDESTPMVDARLSDGSRFNAILPPLALDGPMVSIRRFGTNPITRDELVRLGSAPEPVMKLLECCVEAKLNILVSGGTGSGKTTLLNVLSAFIPRDERILTIEDAAELRLQQEHVVRLETRPRNLEGEGEVTARDLVKNALRMRPDRIIVGEIRGVEVIDMLQAMNTGHEGSISTVHANSPRHALGRMQTMVGLGMGNIPGPAIREMISDALDLIIQVDRLQDGTRRITTLTEIVGIEAGIITTQEIFRFKQRTIEPTGKVRGWFESTGVRPSFATKLESYGLPVPASLFSYKMEI